MAEQLNELCSRDVVIDTCVLAHSGNPNAPEFTASLAVVVWLRDRHDVALALDDTGKGAPSPDTSVLYSEYVSTLGPQSAAIVLVASLLAAGRVAFVPRPSRPERDLIRRLVPKNTRDRAVLGAAVTSTDKVLVSDDHDDFPDSLRDDVRSSLGVTVIATSLCA